jgi:hypothetical protein
VTGKKKITITFLPLTYDLEPITSKTFLVIGICCSGFGIWEGRFPNRPYIGIAMGNPEMLTGGLQSPTGTSPSPTFGINFFAFVFCFFVWEILIWNFVLVCDLVLVIWNL